MALKLAQVLALSSAVSAQHVPQGAVPEKGIAVGVPHPLSPAFDDWNERSFNGAVYQMCAVNAGLPVFDYIVSVGLSYAGVYVHHGPLSPWDWDTARNCITLDMGEMIKEISLGLGRMGDNIENGITAIRVVTSSGRTKEWGKQSASMTKLTPPKEDQTLVALYGSAATTALGVNQLGVYWGYGGGVGRWEPVLACPGCSDEHFIYTECSTRTGSVSVSVTSAWKLAVPSQMQGSFSVPGANDDGKMNVVSGDMAQSVTASAFAAFENQVCTEMDWKCNRSNLFQWVFHTNFDLLGDVQTRTSNLVCTDAPAPACLPGYFKGGDATTCTKQAPDASTPSKSLSIIV